MNVQPNLGMQVTTFENPLGIDGFEFDEFAAPALQLPTVVLKRRAKFYLA